MTTADNTTGVLRPKSTQHLPLALQKLAANSETMLEALSAISALSAIAREHTIYENRPDGLTDYHTGGLFSAIDLLSTHLAHYIEAMQNDLVKDGIIGTDVVQ